MSKKVKTFAIIILIIALIIGVLSYLDYSSSDTTSYVGDNSLISNKAAGLTTDTIEKQAATDEFSTILASIRGINIDTSIFENLAYKTLRDYPILLGTDIVGRQNPFAPVGSDIDVILNNVEFQTIQPASITSTTAVLGAQINTLGNDSIGAFFEYGTSDTFGTSTGPVLFSKNGTALFSVSGLIPSTKYFVRATLVNGSDLITGNIMTFTTTKSTR